MKKLFLSMSLLALIACGGENKSESTNNGVNSEERYTSLANSYEETTLMHDNLRIFKLDLIKDKTFRLLQQTNVGLKPVVKSTWKVSGTTIVLDDLGTGTYLDFTRNGVPYDCISMSTDSLSQFVQDELAKRDLVNPYLQFCKRR